MLALILAFIVYRNSSLSEYKPADDEIALHIQLNTQEDIGLVLFDYSADGTHFSAGISHADKSLIRHDSDNVQVWRQQELSTSAASVDLSIQFTIITEYAEPKTDFKYPPAITRQVDPALNWQATFGESYFVTITGDKTAGYHASLQK